VERSLPNGVHSTFEYTAAHRLSRLIHTDSSGREIASFSYTYDGDGRLQNVTGVEQGRTVQTGYDWDERGRLPKMTAGGVEFDYQYDEAARRMTVRSGGKTVTYTSDGLGRVLKARGVAMSLSPEGAMSARRDDSETTEIRYNYQGRPVEIAAEDVKTRYTWDGEGNLVSMARNGKTSHFVPAAGTGIRLPFVEFGEDGGAELKQLIGQSILGRTGSGPTQFFLEGASGDAGYIVNSQGQLFGNRQDRTALPRAPHRIFASASERPVRSKTGAARNSARFLLAQDESSQPIDSYQPVTDHWNSALAWLGGGVQWAGDRMLQNPFMDWVTPYLSAASPTFDYAANLKMMQITAMASRQDIFTRAEAGVGIWGSIWGGSILEDAQNIRDKYANYAAHPESISNTAVGL
jgi:YD repeat-containing protein